MLDSLWKSARIFAVAMVIGIGLPDRFVRAQSVSISPLVTIEQLKGSQNKTTITVKNSSDKPIRARIITTDFTYHRENGFTAIPSHAKSAVPYLQFSPREFAVPAGVSRTVRVGFTIPPSLPDGEYSVALYIEGLPEQQVTQIVAGRASSTTLKPRIASIFFITKGAGSPQLSVASAQWDPKIKQPVLVLNNQGVSSAYPNLSWKILKSGSAVANGVLEGIVLVAGKDRTMPIKMMDSDRSNLTPGKYLISGEIVSRSGGEPVKFETQLIIPDR
jgi:P pilus assembly chaperone PapD